MVTLRDLNMHVLIAKSHAHSSLVHYLHFMPSKESIFDELEQ